MTPQHLPMTEADGTPMDGGPSPVLAADGEAPSAGASGAPDAAGGTGTAMPDERRGRWTLQDERRRTRYVRSWLTRRDARGRTRGQSLVEFALVLPIFLLLFAAILDLGRLAVAQISVTNAAREGAFQAAQTPTSYDPGQPCDTTTNLVICRVQLEARGSGVTIAPDDVTLTCSPDCTPAIGSTVTVSVNGRFQLLTTILSSFFGGSQTLTFSATSTHQLEKLPTPSVAPAPGSPSPSPTPTPTPTPSVGASPTPTPSPSPSPTPTPTPDCIPPSAGFTYDTTPPSLKAPVTITVLDTSVPVGSCIGSWKWEWGDGYVSFGKDPGDHTYLVPGTYVVYLTVSGPAGTNTSGGATIKVKP
jgi:Flp pilus assembly protein TadG